MRKALTIAGSDCSGGAGIQADLKTMSALGVFGMSVVVSVVAENTARVISVEDISPKVISDQIDAVFEDIFPDAVKVGMLSSQPVMETVAAKLAEYKPQHIVIDPVMYAKNGSPLMHEDAVSALIASIVPVATVLTPNIPEAERITGLEIKTIDDMKRAGEKIVSMGAKAALVKGGHYIGDASDVLFDGSDFHIYTTKRINTKNTHGTGCTLSSAIAAFAARGEELGDAVRLAKKYLTDALKAGAGIHVGNGFGPVNHFYDYNCQQSDGQVRRSAYKIIDMEDSFTTGLSACPASVNLQFITHFTDKYSYIDSAIMALEGGCRWIQLRMKDADESEIERTALKLIPECRRKGAVFVIDDHVELALQVGADGVHLGKNDMPVDEARKLAGKDFIIGGTANTFEDVSRLASQGADYIGCGPYRFTTTKKKLAPMLGLEGYKDILSRMRAYGISLPLVAIGGITCDDIPQLMEAGVSGIALSGSILRAVNPVDEMKKVVGKLQHGNQ